MKTLLLAAALAAWVGSVAAADTASGSFKNQNLGMQIKSALAFPGKSLLDKDDVIVVAVTSAEMDADALAAYYDRRRAVDQRVRTTTPAWSSSSSARTASTRATPSISPRATAAAIAAATWGSPRRSGSPKGASRERSRAPTRTAHSTSPSTLRSCPTITAPPLPPDGGAPGKAYLDYHAALVKRDANALRTALSDEGRKIQAGAIKEGKGGAYMNYLAKEHPTQSVRITKGWSDGKSAVILFDGEGAC